MKEEATDNSKDDKDKQHTSEHTKDDNDLRF